MFSRASHPPTGDRPSPVSNANIKNQKSKVQIKMQKLFCVKPGSLNAFWVLICHFAFCILIFNLQSPRQPPQAKHVAQGFSPAPHPLPPQAALKDCTTCGWTCDKHVAQGFSPAPRPLPPLAALKGCTTCGWLKGSLKTKERKFEI